MLMSRESQAPEKYEDIIRHIGAPNKTVTDNAQVCTGRRWTTINCKYCIETGLTVPHHQHKCFAEDEGGNMKFKLIKLFHNTPMLPYHTGVMVWSFWTKYVRLLISASLDLLSFSEACTIILLFLLTRIR